MKIFFIKNSFVVEYFCQFFIGLFGSHLPRIVFYKKYLFTFLSQCLFEENQKFLKNNSNGDGVSAEFADERSWIEVQGEFE